MNASLFDKFPEIDIDEKIYLRQLRTSDARQYYEYLSDPKVNRYISDDDIPSSQKSAEQELSYWIELFNYKRSFYWGIAKKDTDTIIGTCGFNNWSKTHARAEISYDLARKSWGKGIMTKSMQSVCDFAFGAMGVKRIQATVAHDNLPSIKLLKRLNFTNEGSMRSYGILHGTPKDFYMMSLLYSDLSF